MFNPKLYWYEICHKIYISQLSMLFFHAFLMGLLEICNSWFLAHNWTSGGCLAKLRSCFILCLLFTFLIICALPPPLAPIPTCHLFSKLLPVTRFRVQVIKVWTKGSLIFLVSSKNTTIQIKNTKSVRWLCPPSHPPSGPANQNYFLTVILSRHVLRNVRSCLLCQNLVASEAALQLLWRLVKFSNNLQKFGNFLKLGLMPILYFLLKQIYYLYKQNWP